LAVALRRGVVAERQHARAEHGAIAGENQLAHHRPELLGHGLLRCSHKETTVSSAAHTSNMAPASRLGMGLSHCFSTVAKSPISAIQKMFMTPTANMTSISAQQQPRHHRPCSVPSRKIRDGSLLQRAKRMANGLRHLSRQACFSLLN